MENQAPKESRNKSFGLLINQASNFKDLNIQMSHDGFTLYEIVGILDHVKSRILDSISLTEERLMSQNNFKPNSPMTGTGKPWPEKENLPGVS
ncbi:MAG: hypothetical protein WC648_05400 [Candidatus Paceibacterota bacterium]|jgi:hypothetical protein